MFGALAMLSYFVLAVYMIFFILGKWNLNIVIPASALYEQEKNIAHEQERRHLL